ncbi:helix-turn-helix domain-containing protein [Paenibacillus sp. PR3]|uniref:Helix-turn-helix domain-containing protein n=1 Tax=Paenibacillus terricola TaxID=2763503 RepID=A0ABR8MMG2_9BACL|nr:AraC family transcriptional regulator [Paenibacillus terricola]MBD3917203.1 helix-turn-helix domain-containing protein [Paenibacillus terricola]
MMTELPSIELGNLDVKLSLGRLLLNVHYVKFGIFHHPMPEHSHSACSYELHYIPRGQGTLVIHGERFPLVPGSIYMTGPNIPHEQLSDPADPMAEYCVFLEAANANANSQASIERAPGSDDNLLAERMLATPFWIGQDRFGLLQLFQLLAREAADRELGYPRCVARLLEIILVQFLRQYEDPSPSITSVPVRTLDDSRLLLIENAFLYRYASITLGQLASELGLSARQTERAIRKQYDLSFHAKKTEARMAAAARLLTTTALPIASVSKQLGFATPESFSVAFKKHFTFIPTEFRRSSQLQKQKSSD